MTQLINEINRYRGLMGLQDLNEVLLTNNGDKNLLLETSIKPPKFNFPKVNFEGKKITNFDQLKRYAATKGISDIGLKSTNEFNAFNSTIPDIATLSKRLEAGTAYRNFLDNIYLLRKKNLRIITKTEEILNNIKRNAGKGSFGPKTNRQKLLDVLGPEGLNLENWDNSYGFRDQLLWAYKNLDPEGYEKLKLKFKDANTINKSVLDSEVPDKPVVSTKSLDDSIKSKTDPGTGKKYKPNDVKEKWKLAGGDETKLDIAWNQRGWVPGQKVPKDLKVKGGSPTPTTPTVSPGGKYKVGTPGYIIESTPKPDGSGYYEFTVVRDEWRADGGGDNVALGKAWKENWRPGDEIPEKYSASYKAETKTKSEEILNNTIIDENSGLKQLITAENKKIDPTLRTQQYDIKSLSDDFNLDENPTTEQIKKLTDAWRKGYRGKLETPTFFETYPQYVVKDTKKAIEGLVNNAKDTDNLNNRWKFDDVTYKFGLSDPPTRQDLELFYNAWDEGKWRPKTKDGRVNPVPDIYQTERYKRRIALEKGEIFKDLPKDYTNKANPNILTSFIRWIGRTFLYRQVGFWEDVTRTAIKTEQGYLQGKIDTLLKDALNKIRSGKDIDMFYLRTQILKAGANGDVANNFKLFMLDKYYKKAILDDIDNLIDDPELKDAVKIQVDTLFERIKGKSIEEFTRDNTEWASWFRSAGDDNEPSLNVIEAIRDTYTSKNGYLKKVFAVFWRDYISGPSGKKFLMMVSQRVINLVKSGTIWTKAELLAMRSVDNFSSGGAWKDLFIRKVIAKVLLPTLYATGVWAWNSTMINKEEANNKDLGEFSQDPWFTQVMKEVSDEFLIGRVYKEIWGDDKTNPYWKLAESFGNLTSSQIDDMLVYFGKTSKTEDVVKGDYRIRYLVPQKKLLWGSIEWNADYWKYFPAKDRYGTHNEVQLEIEELLNSNGALYICDVSSEKSKKLKEKLDIPENKKTFCQIKFFCNLTTGGCQELNDPDPKYTGKTYNSLEECASKSNCEANKKAFDDQQKDAEQKSEIEKLRKEREQKQEENKTTVTTSQDISFINKVVKNRTDGGKTWRRLEENGTFQPLVDAKNGKAWSMEFENVIYIYSVTTDGKVYEKSIPKDQFNRDNLNKINSDNGWVEVKSSITVTEAVYRKIKKLMLKEMRVGNRRRIFEEKDEKFGEEKFEHWKKTFEFSSQDPETKEWKRIEKETIESKQVDIEKWVEHYLKSNDEDDAFVRAVIHVFKMDKNEKNHVKKVAFNKGLAHLSENFEVGGLLRVLSVIRESKELEIWSVKYYADGNWELVKGSFTDDELKNVGKTVKDREKKDEERKKPVEGLKKKELTGIQLLNQDEKKGLVELPSQVKRKLLEKLRKGWVTEKPYEFFNEFYSVSDINTVFNDKLKIYKLNPTKEFFESLVQNSPRIFPRKGICKALDNLETTEGSNEKSKSVLKHILQKCQTKFKGEYGVKQMKTN
jgi:hypothetical protein